MITAGGKNLTPSEIENTMKASPFIKEGIVVAEGRKFVGALVQIDYETVGQWAQARRIPFTHFRSSAISARERKCVKGMRRAWAHWPPRSSPRGRSTTRRWANGT